jgi:hypothetical protein
VEQDAALVEHRAIEHLAYEACVDRLVGAERINEL